MKVSHLPILGRRSALLAGITFSSLFFTSPSIAQADVPGAAVTAPAIRQERNSFARLAKALKPAVVNIEVEKVVAGRPGPLDIFGDLFDERGSRKPKFDKIQTGQGSGVIISKDGYILTNNHVVSNGRRVKVTLSDGRELAGKVIGADPKTDIALVKIEGGNNLPYAEMGNSETMEVGDWVMAIGNPFGLEATVTVGVLSGKGRVIGAGPYDDYLQTDASINPGNSGGPLFNTEGQIIGINTAIISESQGIGFSVPINLAKEISQQLRVTGRVVRGYLGLGVQSLKPKLKEALRLPADTKGALVAQVQPKSPAALAGIQVEDVITAINGKPILSDHDVLGQSARLPVGKVAQVSVLRKGALVVVPVNIVERPEEKKVSLKAPVEAPKTTAALQDSLGIELAPLSADIASELQTKNLSGVVIGDVEPNSAAARAGLERGDIIRKVNNHNVSSLDEFVKVVQKEEHTQGLAFLVERGGSSHFVVLDT